MGKFSGYADTGVELDDLELFGSWVIVEEEWERPDAPAGIILVKPINTTTGVVAAVGRDADEDINVGDRILFQAWEGGRWSFRRDGQELRTLIMDEQFIVARLG